MKQRFYQIQGRNTDDEDSISSLNLFQLLGVSRLTTHNIYGMTKYDEIGNSK